MIILNNHKQETGQNSMVYGLWTFTASLPQIWSCAHINVSEF